jgi:peptidoglycan/LPS O-acetylase OafA/YrhL
MSSQQAASKNRLKWIDYTKGVAILGIICFHFFQNYPERTELVKILDRNGARLGYAAVDLFFVIAGFNTSYSFASIKAKLSQGEPIKNNWLIWLKKRLSRLYPTYWLAIVLTLLIYYLFSQIKVSSVLDLVFIFIGLPGYPRFRTINPGFWFFSVILQAYLAIPLILYICKSKPTRILLVGLVIGVLNKLVCLVLLGFQDLKLFSFFLQLNFLGSYFFPLCLGLYWGFTYFDHKTFRRVDLVISSSVFVISLMIYLSLMVSQIKFVYMLGFDIVFTPLFFIVFYYIFEYLENNKFSLNLGLNFLSLAGLYSYQIYLIHQPLLFVLLPYLKQNVHGDASLRLIVSIIVTSVLLSVYVFLFTQLESFLRKAVGKISSKPA